ncbi:MAG: hypothetical protein LBJ25_04480, partial [Candidatus Margulisbacteria bacterium]|nr:hypothetical protein [Candidatus Margulisiibacteriota bacterium]
MQRDRLLYKLGKIGAAGDLLFGRPQIKAFLTKAMPYSTVLDLGAGQGEDLLCAQEVFKISPPPPPRGGAPPTHRDHEWVGD